MCVETREARDDRAHCAIIAQTEVDRLVANPVRP
jgi:hypothetical protein